MPSNQDCGRGVVIVKLGTAEAPDGPDDLYRSFEAFEVILAAVTGRPLRECRLHDGDCAGYRARS